MVSPYEGLSPEEWEAKTRELIEKHPLNSQEICEVVIQVWDDIFESGIGSKPFKIGTDLFPRPQVMGFFLHELIPLEFAQRYPGVWRRDETPYEKDMVYIRDQLFSIEIKTSSSAGKIYGNRSYTQKSDDSKKKKYGYYLAINYEKFSKSVHSPKIKLIRFGWIDQSDWIGQKAQTGQQARLSRDVERYKLLKLPIN